MENYKIILYQFLEKLKSGDFADLGHTKTKLKEQSDILLEHLISLHFDHTPELYKSHCEDVAGILNTYKQKYSDDTNYFTLKKNYSKLPKEREELIKKYKNLLWNNQTESSFDSLIKHRKKHMDDGIRFKNDWGGKVYRNDGSVFNNTEKIIDDICVWFVDNKPITDRKIYSLTKEYAVYRENIKELDQNKYWAE